MISGEAWPIGMAIPSGSSAVAACRPPANSVRQRLLQDIDQALCTQCSRVDFSLAALLADAVADPALLCGLTLAGSPQRYTRHLIEDNSMHCVLAIVWLPGQMSSVHSHRAWCALGVHRGTLTETHFEPADSLHGPEGSARPSGCRQLYPGSTSSAAANDPRAHRMANLGVEPAISIHVYGAAYDRLGADVNHVWAD